ncbi:thermonuclease family protein [Fulvimarina pelagi]|nr:thermonuclease family protein [Fulvimarina pelagi]
MIDRDAVRRQARSTCGWGRRGLIALALVLSVLVSPAFADPIEGRVNAVIDGDGLVVAGTEIRLCGIDAPEATRPGGFEATAHLRALVEGRTVRCLPVGEGSVCDGLSRPTSYDRIVAQCFVGDLDLAGDLVRHGFARDWPRYSGGAYGG